LALRFSAARDAGCRRTKPPTARPPNGFNASGEPVTPGP
jgi:hypothetical protein